jgi:SAM-dependent methyltransferase
MHSIPTEPTACPVCGPTAGADFSFQASDRLHGLGGEFSYFKCQSCGVLFQNPRVQPAAALDVYPQDYIAHIKVQPKQGFQALTKNAMRWLRGASLPPQITRGLGPTSRVLDVGCGAGEFLNDVRQHFGCEVSGLDLSESSKRAAKEGFGIDVFCGSLEQAPWAPASFDLITSWWSLEHMPDPAHSVARMGKLLRAGGQLLIAVPNAQSAVAKLFGSRWYHLDCPRHYHLWTPASLRKLVEREGLSHQLTTFDKSPWGLLGSLQYVVFGDNYRAGNTDKLRGNVKVAPLFLPLTFALGLLHYSDTMVAVFKKPAAGAS